MQTSRVNGLTSGVFAFLEPASCLNQKGSDTRRDNTTFPVADYSPIYLFLLQKRREREKASFPRSRGWTTEQREGVSPPDVYVLWFSPDIHYLLKNVVDVRPYPAAPLAVFCSLPRKLLPVSTGAI